MTCPKCAGDDIGTTYHAQGCNATNCTCTRCDYGSHAKQHTEHLHRVCRTCRYDWTEDTAGC